MIAAVILAGGQARRMGGVDKPLLRLAGRPILAHILDRLAGQAAPIAISANGDPARFAAFGLPVLPDGGPMGQGPLAGLLAGLNWAAGQGADVLLTVPGDTPFIPADLVATLAPAPSRAASLGRAHHLLALWPIAARAPLHDLLSHPGPRSVGAFGDRIGMRPVDFPAMDGPTGPYDPFLNINTPDDLAKAQRIMEHPR